jgi:corrinoid protein of di/trimethylamine methyltransferase
MPNDHFFTDAAASIVDADREAAIRIATDALAAGISPSEIMQQGFVAGIAEVGELFESGELFLPELMMSAQAMEGAMSVTNAALGEGGAAARAKIVIGTVQGDVHDIGKAIVIAYLKANSYEVTDLGRDVPLDTFLAKAAETHAQVIGMSALLTTTMEEQKKLIARLTESGERDKYKVVVGGAPATQRWADQIGADAYAEDASDGVKKIDALLDR